MSDLVISSIMSRGALQHKAQLGGKIIAAGLVAKFRLVLARFVNVESQHLCLLEPEKLPMPGYGSSAELVSLLNSCMEIIREQCIFLCGDFLVL